MGKPFSILFRTRLAASERTNLRAFAAELCAQVLAGQGFTCLITRDVQLRELNRTFLQHDYATDVLSFPAPEGKSLGEIAISIDRARDQAAEHGHSLLDELRILMLHGVLHLAGMDHESDRGAMRRTETKWRKHFALPSGLIERSRR
jgi:probable rRNA maturation factor